MFGRLIAYQAAVHALSKCVRSLMAVNVLCFMLGHSAVRRHRPRVSRMQQTIRDLSGQTRQDKTRLPIRSWARGVVRGLYTPCKQARNRERERILAQAVSGSRTERPHSLPYLSQLRSLRGLPIHKPGGLDLFSLPLLLSSDAIARRGRRDLCAAPALRS